MNFETLKKLVKENYQYLSELDIIGDDKIVKDYSITNPYSSELAKGFDEITKKSLNKDISRILESGKSPFWSHTKSLKEGKQKEFNYITSTLAAIYKSADGSEKENIRNFIFVAYNPYMVVGKDSISHDLPSPFSLIVAKSAGIQNQLALDKSTKADTLRSYVADSIYEAVDYTLDKYEPSAGSYGGFLNLKASNLVKDKIKSSAGKAAFSTVSGDDPLYSGDEGGNEETLLTRHGGSEDMKMKSKDNSNLANVISDFVESKLVGKKNALTIFNMFGKEGKDLETIAKETGSDYGAIRTGKSRLESFITQFVENGEFQKYIKDKTGESVVFPNNKFALKKVDEMKKEIKQISEITKIIKQLIKEEFNK